MKAKRKQLVIGILVVLLIGTWYTVSKIRAAGKNKPIVQTAGVETGTVSRTVSATGILQPLTTVDVKSNAGGTVDLLAVDVGDSVKPGQLIAKIDPTDSRTALEQASANLTASNARLQQAKESLKLQEQQSELSIKQAEEAYRAARARLVQAEVQARVQPDLTKASIKQAEASKKSAEESLRQLREAGVPQGMAQTKASYDQAQAALQKAERNYTRQEELYEKGFISTGAYDTAKLELENAKAQASSAKQKWDTAEQDYESQLKAAEARLDQAEAALENAKINAIQDEIRQQEFVSAKAALEQAAVSLENAKANLRQNKIKAADVRTAETQIVSNKAQVENAQAQLDYTTITAPRAGIILKKYVEEGTIVTSGRSSFAGTGEGTSIVQLGDLSRMLVLASVDETDIASVETGQMVDITLDAYPDELFEGVVTKIDPQTEVTQNVTTIPVTVELLDPDARLKPGMNATCTFVIDRSENALRVPSEAVVEDDGHYTVTVIENGKQVDREVKVGITGDAYTEILSGLEEDDIVVTSVTDAQSDSNSSMRPGGMPGPFGMGRRR